MKASEGTRPSTLRGYRWLIETHVRPALGRTPLDKVTPTMIRRLLTAKTADNLSATTVKHIHGMIRNVLADAEREELIHRNPARAVRPPSVRPAERRALTIDEAKRLIDTIRGDRLEALWVCALTVGLRRGELLGLRWSDIDSDNGTLTVRQTVLRVDGRLVFADPSPTARKGPCRYPTKRCNGSRLTVRAKRPTGLRAGRRWHDLDLVFASTIGTPIEPRNVDRAWHTQRDRAGLPWLRAS